MDETMRFGLLFEPIGNAFSGWRAPEVERDAAVDMGLIEHLAQLAERARFDYLFVADSVTIEPGAKPYYLNRYEPFTLLAALSRATERIGLVATVSTTFTDPYTIARQTASLDLMSNGRAGINLVTTAWESAAANFGMAGLPDHDDRYERADEYLSVIRGLWDSYEDDAFVQDKEANVYLDWDKQHRLDHVGEFYQVRGPLNIQRSKQGQPVIFQAGSSDRGRDFAAQHADAIFAKFNRFEDAVEYRQDIRRRAARFGRDPDRIKVYLGAHVIVAETQAGAEAKFQELASLISDEEALKWLSFFYNYHDFSQYSLDDPFPDLSEIGDQHMQGLTSSWAELARRENLTLREVGRLASLPKEEFFGTPEVVADALEKWFREGAADGFLLSSWLQPSGLTDFTNLVIPELIRRGLYDLEYSGETLRDQMNLPAVPNRHSE